METLTPWNELLSSAGKNVEDAGRQLKDQRRTWSISELQALSSSLKSCAAVLDKRIQTLQEG
jgi:hypothetical protein